MDALGLLKAGVTVGVQTLLASAEALPLLSCPCLSLSLFLGSNRHSNWSLESIIFVPWINSG
jgi:hypothetical protein